MRLFKLTRTLLPFLAFALVAGIGWTFSSAQSRRQPPTSNEKKNKRPAPGQPAEKQEEPLPPDLMGKPQEADKVTVTTQIVNVDAVVYHKKSGQIVNGLKRENFSIFTDNNNQQTITNFSTPEAPITLAMVLEYSKLGEMMGYYGSGGAEPGQYEMIRPTAMFLSQFIKPEDYVSVIAYDLRPTPITDFTNDPARIQQVISLLLRNSPAFSDSNLFDALKLTLVGGKGDAAALDNSEQRVVDYAGMVAVQGSRRRAVLLVASGLDTFSKINQGEARKIVQNAGIPIYIIGTGNLFLKKYDHLLDPGRNSNILGIPLDRMSFLQANNILGTFAKDTGGAFYPITFAGELPKVLGSINALLRSQYSLAFNPGDVHDGKQHKIKVSVDVDGDGVNDDKEYVIQARTVYNSPKPDGTTKQ
jgi:Ca-activated chloride channel homolog